MKEKELEIYCRIGGTVSRWWIQLKKFQNEIEHGVEVRNKKQ